VAEILVAVQRSVTTASIMMVTTKSTVLTRRIAEPTLSAGKSR